MTASPELTIDRIRKDAQIFRSYGDESRAKLLEKCADIFRTSLRERDNTILTIKEAAQGSCYSPGHLGRIVRDMLKQIEPRQRMNV